ncbi:MAG: transcription antitermination factor NusB [Planctomycetaceae bacterium]
MDPRKQAAALLADLDARGGTAKERWDSSRTGAETALVLGTLRRRGTLDAILQVHASRRLALLRPPTRAVLRAALFELLFLDDAPAYAIVHAAVENVKALGRPGDASFVNGLLRGIQRGFRTVPRAEATDPRRTLPRNGEALSFKQSVFPDRNHDPAGFLAARGSTAPWIAARRLAELGLARALVCLDLQARTPDTVVRIRAGREAEARAALSSAGLTFRDGPRPGLLVLPPAVRASALFEACGALVTAQDAVASLVAPFLAPPPSSRVLDACAAPGGKTTHLAELVGPAGRVVACDVTEERLELVRENAARLSLDNIECVLVPAAPGSEFDAVLVDAPCSNTGVLARRPEARWRAREKDLRGLADRQLRILREAAERARPGAAVVYSTCSLEAEENLGVVESFLKRGGFLLEEARTIQVDEGGGDGGFMARLRRV